MPKRSSSRDTAKAEYVARCAKGEKVNLRELADELGVTYQTVRNWKTLDKWDSALPKKRGAASLGIETAPGIKMQRAATRAPRVEIKMQRRTGPTAPSFLICCPKRNGAWWSKRRWEAGKRWSMK